MEQHILPFFLILIAKHGFISYFLSLSLSTNTYPLFCTVTESALDYTVHDAWNVVLGWWNWTWHFSPYPFPIQPPTHSHKHIHTICQPVWHIFFKAALKAFLLGIHLMKSALKALFPLAGTSQPSEGPWPGKNRERQRENTFYRLYCTESSAFNICQKLLPSSNTVACSCVFIFILKCQLLGRNFNAALHITQ